MAKLSYSSLERSGGQLFIAAAERPVVIGDFTGPKGINYGMFYGVAHIGSRENPPAFLGLVFTSYVGFGAAILGCVWFVTRAGVPQIIYCRVAAAGSRDFINAGIERHRFNRQRN